MSTEVGVAHVSIIAKTTGLGKDIARQFGSADSEAAKTGQKMGKSLSGGFKGVLKTAALGATVAAAVGAGLGKVAYDIGKTFDTMSDTIRVGTGATGKALDELNASAKNVGKNVPATFEETGTVVADLNTLLGLTGKPLENMSTQFLNLSRITGTDVQTNMQAVTRAFGDWGVETAKQPEFLDKLFKVSQATGVGVDKLASQVVQFGAPMRGMGFSIDETAALLGQFEKTGVNTELVMGSMRIALGKFAKEGKNAPEALRELMEQIKDAPDDTAAASMAMEIFGQRAGADMADSIRGGKFEIDDLVKAVAGSSDTINKAAEDTMSFGEKWQMFKNRALLAVEPVSSAVFNLAGVMMDKALPVIEEITGGIMAFGAAWKANDGDITSSGFPGFMEKLAYETRQVFDYVKNDVVPALRSMADWFRRNDAWLVPLIATVGSGVLAFKAYLGVIKLVTLAKTAMVAKLAAAKVAMIAFNAVMIANPIGLVIAALVALGVGLVLAWKHSETFRKIVTGAWDGIKAVASAVADWFTGTLVPGFRSAVDAVGGFFAGLNENVIQPVWSWIKGAISNVADWFTGTVVPAFQEAADRIGGFFDFLYRNFIAPFVWAFEIAIAKVTKWFQDTVVPAFQAASDAIGKAFRWLYDNFVKPVWTWIQDKIGAVMAWFNVKRLELQARLDALGAVFRRLYDSYVKPVWDWIKSKIDAVVTWFQNVLVPMFRAGIERVMSKFSDFKNRAFSVWDNVKTKLRDGWSWIDTHVFSKFRDGLDKLKTAFTDVKDGIGETWDKLKAKVKEPISFVVNKVLNPFLAGYNTINDAWSGTDIGADPKKPIPGFRKGGYTGNLGKDDVAGVVHGREHVTRAESTADVERHAPGFLDRLNRHGAAALGEFNNPAHMAVGARVFGGAGSFSNSLQHAVYRSGQMNVQPHGSLAGWGLDGAIGMLDRATNAVKVKRGGGHSSGNTVGVAAANYPDWWGGYYMGNTVMLNNRSAGNMAPVQKRTLLAHELGHALGLPHSARMHGGNGARSIMNYDNMYQHNSVTAADVAALSAIYGGSGKGGVGGDVDDGSWVVDMLKKLVSSPIQKLKDMFKGNLFADMAKGLADKVVDGITKKAKDMVFSKGVTGDDIQEKVNKGGKWDDPVGTIHKLPTGVSSIYNGTGGNEFFQRVDPNASSGPMYHIENFNALDTDDALRKLRRHEQRRETLAYVA